MDGVRAEHRQHPYPVRLEWGREGVAVLARDCAVVVVVDVLSFSTAVDVAVGRGARVLPQAWGDRAAAVREAVAAGATPAGPRDGSAPSLRPSSLRTLATGTLLALPSPNGATLCMLADTHAATVLIGCLRNATAVAAAALDAAGDDPIGLVPAGERWPDGTMRVAVEDVLGAGAIAAALPTSHLLPTETALAVAAFRAAREAGLRDALSACSSGRELLADGYEEDVALAAELDVSAQAPRLHGGVVYSSRNNGHIAS